MKLVFEGHACFRLLSGDVEILVDPFISGNPQCGKSLGEFRPQLILVTHGHNDHLGDALPIARAAHATLAAQVDLLNAIPHKGIDTISFNMGGTFRYQHISVTMVPAWHGNCINTEAGYVNAGLAAGYIIDDGKFRVYHAGDTCLFGDMATVISRYDLDCALLPIGDFYTMGVKDAVTAASWLRARTVIPMHYDTFPVISQDAEAFRQQVEDRTECRCVGLQPGESLELQR